MNEISFVWDDEKNRINQNKHGISFEEAQTVFYDDNAILFDDPDHSADEERYLIIGITQNTHVCTVSHCYRENDAVIRIISARKATTSEEKYYRNR